ncbi:MAG: UDP-glucose 4-epimerase GalE, partial [Hyphomicrobiales bacterium]
YIHVTDLVRAHVAGLKYLRAGGVSRVLNCGYGRGFSVLEVIDAVKRASGVDFMVKAAPRRPGDPAALVADVNAIRRFLDWKPEFGDLDTIVDQALRWERHLERFRKAS